MPLMSSLEEVDVDATVAAVAAVAVDDEDDDDAEEGADDSTDGRAGNAGEVSAGKAATKAAGRSVDFTVFSVKRTHRVRNLWFALLMTLLVAAVVLFFNMFVSPGWGFIDALPD